MGNKTCTSIFDHSRNIDNKTQPIVNRINSHRHLNQTIFSYISQKNTFQKNFIEKIYVLENLLMKGLYVLITYILLCLLCCIMWWVIWNCKRRVMLFIFTSKRYYFLVVQYLIQNKYRNLVRMGLLNQWIYAKDMDFPEIFLLPRDTTF